MVQILLIIALNVQNLKRQIIMIGQKFFTYLVFHKKLKEWAHRRYGNKEKGKYLLDESFVKDAEDGSTSEWYYLIGSNTHDFSNDNFPNGKQIRKHIMKRLSQSEYELFIKQVKIDREAATNCSSKSCL